MTQAKVEEAGYDRIGCHAAPYARLTPCFGDLATEPTYSCHAEAAILPSGVYGWNL